jgi:hypothetical protein
MGFFNQQRKEGAADAKSIRDDLIYAIRTRLSAFQGSEGGGMRGLHLYLVPGPELRAEYEAAVHLHEPTRFKKEVQRIADDYDIALPAGWEFIIEFRDTLPAEATPIPGQPAGIWISTAAKAAHAVRAATLRVLEGEAEKEEYLLEPGEANITIGREKKVQLPDGFIRINTIAFLGDSVQEANRSVSRQHAHIRYDAGLGQFLLFADAGGLPPNNKTKVKGRGDAAAIKLQSSEVPHLLRDGDQVILGNAALLQFSTGQSNHSNG